jgi:hypothetical protein
MDPAGAPRIRRASRDADGRPTRRRPRTGASLIAAWWAAVAVLLAAWAVPASAAAETAKAAADGDGREAAQGGEKKDSEAERLAELSEIQALAEAARGLRFTQPPVYKRLRQEEIAPYFHKELLENFEEGELDNLLLAYEKLGLIPSSEGLLDDLVEAYADQVVAFYDQDTDTVHLIGDLKVPAVMQRIAELHELVHALQDQHFDLDTLPLKDKHTDRSTAALALVEGDAMLATVEYARKHARLSLPDLIETVLGVSSDAPKMPYLLDREMTFVYTNGFDFARALYKRGGWAALGEAFASPPVSTEQVLHYREKYIEARDEPTPVELPDLSAALGPRWRLVADDVLGELYVQILFRLRLSALRAGKPSRGWDGDRLHLYRLEEADGTSEKAAGAYVLVWSTAWDTERDAEEFAEAYLKVVRKKLGADGKPERDGSVVTITGKDEASDGLTPPVAFIVSAGTRVLTIEGRPESAARAALKALASGGSPGDGGSEAGAEAHQETQ